MYVIYEVKSGEIIGQQTQDFTAEGHASYWVGDAAPDMRERFYIIDGQLVDRPAKPVLPTSGVAPLTVDLSQIVAGSRLQIRNSDGDTLVLEAFDDPLVLTGADRYELELYQPFPHRNDVSVIEVTSA